MVVTILVEVGGDVISPLLSVTVAVEENVSSPLLSVRVLVSVVKGATDVEVNDIVVEVVVVRVVVVVVVNKCLSIFLIFRAYAPRYSRQRKCLHVL